MASLPIPPPPLEDLMMKVADGDRNAFEAVYTETADVVYGVAHRILRDPARAEEVAQEVLVDVWRQAGRFDPSKGSVMGWVVVMTRRRAIDTVRSSESARRRDSSQPTNPTSSDPVAEAAVTDDEHGRVRAEVAGLKPGQREAIELAFFDGLTYREVAARLGIPVGTAKTRIRDALTRLKANMGPADD